MTTEAVLCAVAIAMFLAGMGYLAFLPILAMPLIVIFWIVRDSSQALEDAKSRKQK